MQLFDVPIKKYTYVIIEVENFLLTELTLYASLIAHFLMLIQCFSHEEHIATVVRASDFLVRALHFVILT